MIKNKKYIYFAIIPFLLSMAMKFPFPDEIPYGEPMVEVFEIPVSTTNGINFIGVISLFLLIVSLYLIVKGLNKFHVRFVVVAMVVYTFTPPFVATSYQKTFASGIYAISYDSVHSKCSFEKMNETTLHGMCELPFENYSKKDVQFNIEFYKQDAFEDDTPLLSLMNNDAPYKVRLRGNESKRIKIETNIDVSKMKNQIDSGESSEVHLIIKAGKRSRKL
ncbi:hypothetical protein [Neobacillus drentensis]|uniref:hypothetical protein n=1 Tax=Neobacillus drentensis TaxID=220684 RepID=UPI003002AD9A